MPISNLRRGCGWMPWVTVVDALHGMQALERRDTQDQVALASVILLNKSDGAPDVSPLEDRLRAINPGARLHRINRGRADPDDVLDTHSFDLDALGGPDALPDTPPHDHGPGGITALCLRETAPMDEAALERWLTDLLSRTWRDHSAHQGTDPHHGRSAPACRSGGAYADRG